MVPGSAKAQYYHCFQRRRRGRASPITHLHASSGHSTLVFFMKYYVRRHEEYYHLFS